MKINKYYFKIAEISIYVEIDIDIKIEKESVNFIYSNINNKKKDIIFKFEKIKSPLKIEGELFKNDTLYIYKTQKGFIRELHIEPNKETYAWIFPKNNCVEVMYLQGYEKKFERSRDILNVINITNVLNLYNGFILHSSFINWKNKGILFSAPSGTGKSTQADLWNKYENAEIINGDKAGIRKIDNKWIAYGLPFAGTSGIYKNKKAEISHIIILKQGKENKLTKLSPREAFIKIYSETTLHTWDEQYQENIINMITDLVQNVRIYQYECLPDKSAVEFLKKQVIKDNGIGNNINN